MADIPKRYMKSVNIQYWSDNKTSEKTNKGYKMWDKKIKIHFFAANHVVLAEIEDKTSLQNSETKLKYKQQKQYTWLLQIY